MAFTLLAVPEPPKCLPPNLVDVGSVFTGDILRRFSY